MTIEMEQPEVKVEKKEPRVTVDFGSGRWGKIFHLFDTEGREIILYHKDAVALANMVLKIAKENK